MPGSCAGPRRQDSAAVDPARLLCSNRHSRNCHSDQEAVMSEASPSVEASGNQYSQELHRSLHVLGNVMITLSSITPASSVFIIIPAILLAVGTGSFMALLISAVVGVFMAFCWGELCAAYPIAGGDYAVVWHAFKGKAKPLAGPYS